MDSSEALVETYLKSLGYNEVKYEPDGNVPPDFLVDGRIAVEVRRLNQNFDDGGGKGPRGLEEGAIPLWRQVHKYLADLGPASGSSQSWYVFYRFSRPIPIWKDLERELDAVLLPFMADPNPQPFEMRLNVGCEFWLSVLRAPTPKSTFFSPAGHSDEQSGGWLINEIQDNLQLCITEKHGKIAGARAKYLEWWLILSDHIGYGLDEFEQELFRDQVSVNAGCFDKIVLLDPRDATRAFQVHP